jgi:hypothetical protein
MLETRTIEIKYIPALPIPDDLSFDDNSFQKRAFAETYPDERFVQEVLAQITWYHNITKALPKRITKQFTNY